MAVDPAEARHFRTIRLIYAKLQGHPLVSVEVRSLPDRPVYLLNWGRDRRGDDSWKGMDSALNYTRSLRRTRPYATLELRVIKLEHSKHKLDGQIMASAKQGTSYLVYLVRGKKIEIAEFGENE